jgi:hypothetical protein
MDFYVQTNGNLFRDCRDCWKKRVKANRLARIDQYDAYERERAQRPARKAAAQRYLKERRPPEKRRANIAVGNAIRDGRLLRQPCEVCGAAKAEAHHDDYTRPLDVRWLCRKHHLEHHGKESRAA